jgi:hypothetical protein
MYAAWLASEHSRIHLIEQWPDGPRKEAALAAARSALDSLLRSSRSDGSEFRCAVCDTRHMSPSIIEYPKQLQHPRPSDMAA